MNLKFKTIEEFVDNFPFGDKQCEIQIERDLRNKEVYKHHEKDSNMYFKLEWKENWLVLSSELIL